MFRVRAPNTSISGPNTHLHTHAHTNNGPLFLQLPVDDNEPADATEWP